MSNYLKSNVLYGDTVGFLSKKPVKVLSIVWIPNTAGDAVVLNYAPLGPGNVAVAKKGVQSAITSNAIITGALGTEFPSTYVAGDVVDITQCNTKANLGPHVITTGGDDAHIHVEAELTNVAEDNIEITAYTQRVYDKLFSAAKDAMQHHFDGGMPPIPNLYISAIAGSGLVLVHIA